LQSLKKEDVLSSSSEQRREMLSQIDLDGGGGRAAELPLAELERAVVGHFSDRSWDGTCQAAFAQACDSVMHVGARSDDAPASYLWIQRAAFLPFLHHLVYFANHWHRFQRVGAELLSESERGGNGRLMLNDFLRAAAMVGTPVSKADAKEAFDGITRSDDGSGGGGVPFNEFCRWCAHHHISQLPHDHNDEVEERVAKAAATASPKTLLGETVNQMTAAAAPLPSASRLAAGVSFASASSIAGPRRFSSSFSSSGAAPPASAAATAPTRAAAKEDSSMLAGAATARSEPSPYGKRTSGSGGGTSDGRLSPHVERRMVELGLRPIAHQQQQQQQPDATAAAPASTATAGTSGSSVHGGRGSVAAVPELHEAALRELEEENRRANTADSSACACFVNRFVRV
jgi:hypothetical protein